VPNTKEPYTSHFFILSSIAEVVILSVTPAETIIEAKPYGTIPSCHTNGFSKSPELIAIN